MLYLDNSATTQIHPEVLESMMPYLKEEFGNPSGKYYSIAENAKKAVKTAREQVAQLVHCEPDEVVFTSGSTESNNMVLKGIAESYQNEGNHIVTTKVEHPSVLETCKYLETKGYKITFLDVDQYGRIDLGKLEEVIQEDIPILVSVIWGNNEIGSLNNIETIADLCQKHDVFFHTDATQVIGKVNVNLAENPGVKFLSLSGHKIHSPKGIGTCIIRKDQLGLKTKLTPLLHGGEQEDGYRSGTLAVHNIVGLGKAAELACNHFDENTDKLIKLEDELRSILDTKFGDKIKYNNDNTNKIPGLLSIQFLGINNELLIKELAKNDIAISSGSACSSSKPSYVLEAIGEDAKSVRQTIRITLVPDIDKEELSLLNKL